MEDLGAMLLLTLLIWWILQVNTCVWGFQCFQGRTNSTGWEDNVEIVSILLYLSTVVNRALWFSSMILKRKLRFYDHYRMSGDIIDKGIVGIRKFR